MFAFSELTKNAARQRYEYRFRLDDVEVLIALAEAGNEAKAALEERLTRSLTWLFDNLEAILGYCADELLETKNGDWLREGEAPLTARQLKRKLRLKEIDIQPDGSLTLSFLDGGLFWGHLVVVGVEPDRTFQYATLAG